MADSDLILLDHTAKISLDIRKPPVNNLHALNYLPIGLFSLAMDVMIAEGRKHNEHQGQFAVEMFSLIPPIVPCAFHWFSTSVVNYVRLIGLIDLLNKMGWSSDDTIVPDNRKAIRSHCTEYVKGVIPEIYEWRNKVSAHFAITDPYDNDNLGTLEESVMNSIAYVAPRYRAGALKFSTKGETSTLPNWSVTETYERLIERYWPGTVISYDPRNAKPPGFFQLVPN